MVGNFSFAGLPYDVSVEMWDRIVRELNLPITHVNVHSSRPDHKQLWVSKGYIVKEDDNCIWSDGEIGGYCCEMFIKDLEIGNLVNPMEHSTDVGFGLERIIQVMEQKDRIDETSIFGPGSPIVKDHRRSIESMISNGIKSHGKGRGNILKTLLRRLLPEEGQFSFQEELEYERNCYNETLKTARKCWKKHKDKPNEWWQSTFGIGKENLE